MKKKNQVLLLILSIITSVGIIFNPIDTENIIKFNFEGQVLITSIIAIIIYLFYKNKYYQTPRRKSFKILSILFSIFLILGKSIYLSSSFKLVFDDIQYFALSIIKFVSYYNLINLSYLFNCILSWSCRI